MAGPFSALAGSRWHGTAELWLDPLGNAAQVSACTLELDAASVRYTWAFSGIAHHGAIEIGSAGGRFTDRFHAPVPMSLQPVESLTLVAQNLVGPAGRPDLRFDSRGGDSCAVKAP